MEKKVEMQGQKEVIGSLLVAQQVDLERLVESLKQTQEVETDYTKECVSAHVLRQLNKVKEALKKINTKEFGICEACHAGISFSRLMAVPTAAHCIQCAAEKDRENPVKTNQRSVIL